MFFFAIKNKKNNSIYLMHLQLSQRLTERFTLLLTSLKLCWLFINADLEEFKLCEFNCNSEWTDDGGDSNHGVFSGVGMFEFEGDFICCDKILLDLNNFDFSLAFFEINLSILRIRFYTRLIPITYRWMA